MEADSLLDSWVVALPIRSTAALRIKTKSQNHLGGNYDLRRIKA